MKRRSALLAALSAATLVPLLSLPALSSPGGPVELGNQDISIRKLAGTNITIVDPTGPYVLQNGNTAKFTNTTANQVTVVARNSANASIESSVLNPNDNHTFTQSTGASEIVKFEVTDNTKTTTTIPVNYSNKVPGIGGPGLALLALLLTGAGAWALSRKRAQAAV